MNITRQVIKEEIDKVIKAKLNEAALDTFSIETLQSLPSFNQRYKYCVEQLGKHVGKGSARVVFQMDDDKVLKLAFNNKGVAQNEAEADWGAQQYGVVPKLYDVDDNYNYIIMEYVLPAKKADFQHCLGISFEEYVEFVKKAFYYYGDNRDRRYLHPQMTDERFEELAENVDFLGSLYSYMGDYQLPYGDLIEMRNIGLCNRDGDAELVILDSGLTNDIWNEYYRKS